MAPIGMGWMCTQDWSVVLRLTEFQETALKAAVGRFTTGAALGRQWGND